MVLEAADWNLVEALNRALPDTESNLDASISDSITEIPVPEKKVPFKTFFGTLCIYLYRILYC